MSINNNYMVKLSCMSSTSESRSPQGVTRRWVLGGAAAGLAGVVLRRFSPPTSVEATINPLPPFPRPGDQGLGSLLDEGLAIVEATYPELLPHELNPKLSMGYHNNDNGTGHGVALYTGGIPFYSDHLMSIMKSDIAFREASKAIVTALGDIDIQASTRAETNSVIVFIPSHFPLPGQKPPQKISDNTEWTWRQDPKTDGFLGVIRTSNGTGDPNSTKRVLDLNTDFVALSVVQSINLDGLSPADAKQVYEALGFMTIARAAGLSYPDLVIQMNKDKRLILPQSVYEQIP